MEIFLGLMLFIMGTFFGSFLTLAVYRIPLKKDITHEHSFCPNCNHKLGVGDLIPVWSYLFLRGKCRYCGEKIRIRYFLLEILSGLVFLSMYIALSQNGYFLCEENLQVMLSFVFQYITLALIAGIDKENRKINSSILVFGMVCQMIYIAYLYMVKKINVYRYIIYLIVFVFLWLANRKNPESYGIQILLLVNYILFAIGEYLLLPICFMSCMVVVILKLVGVKKAKYQLAAEIPLGFAIGISTITCQIVENFMVNFY